MISHDKIIIGSRGSQLALWQSNWVKSEIENKFPKLKIVIEIIKTTGDIILDSPLSKIGDRGLFTKEIEQALIDDRIDLAVHSLKDLPTILPNNLTIGAITKREDVRDAFISNINKSYKCFEELPIGAKIATGSLRRKCQILNWRPDINIIDMRGNLNTRLEKLDSSDLDGIILASAGIKRLVCTDRISEIIPTDTILPAVGQGALAIEIRENDIHLKNYISHLNCESTSIATKGERAFLHFLEGGCQIPIGTYGRIENNEFHLDAMIGSLDGKKIIRGKIKGTYQEAESIGKELAKTLFISGGSSILEDIRKSTKENNKF